MARALRRHHHQRLLKRVQSYCIAEGMDARRIRKLAQTRTPCSCEMCGNPRKVEGPTTQERRFMCKPANPQE